MITTINLKLKCFTYSHDGVEIVVSFSDVLASDSWKEFKTITFSHLDSSGSKCSTSLARNAFTDNIAFHNRELRGDNFYDLDRNIHLLYRILDGVKYDDVIAEIENLEEQRQVLDDRKKAYKERVDEIIKAHVEKENENAEIKASKEKLDALSRQVANTENEQEKESLSEELAAHMALDQHLREEHKIPDRPEIPPMDFTISQEMKKVITVALDESIPHINLKNVTVESANDALESKLKSR